MHKITFTGKNGETITVETAASEFTYEGHVFQFPAEPVAGKFMLQMEACPENADKRRDAIKCIRTGSGWPFLLAQAALSHGKPFTVPATRRLDFDRECKLLGVTFTHVSD